MCAVRSAIRPINLEEVGVWGVPKVAEQQDEQNAALEGVLAAR